ncbi:MAG: copper amine oxidase N-terminal domain-containing protein [Bacillota bacterium]|nr:copper amine oxidase N-terminal domain-containing protein [Bacillota bacterium]
MKKKILVLCLGILFFLPTYKVLGAKAYQDVDPSLYLDEQITLANGETVDYVDENNLLFFNSEIVSQYKYFIKDSRTLISADFVKDLLGAKLSYNDQEIKLEKDGTNILMTLKDSKAQVDGQEVNMDLGPEKIEDDLYLPLRFVAENLGYQVAYYDKSQRSGQYFHDTKKELPVAGSLIDNYSNILIDEKYDFDPNLTAEKALEKVKATCLQGFENYKKSMKEQIKNADYLDQDLDRIEKDIKSMVYVGQVSRYYKFSMEIYDILYDRLNGKTYFIIKSSGIYIQEVDINSPSLFNPLYIVG